MQSEFLRAASHAVPLDAFLTQQERKSGPQFYKGFLCNVAVIGN